MAAPGLESKVPTRLSPMKTRLNADDRPTDIKSTVNYRKILRFFTECATLRGICASMEIPGDNNIMPPNLDFGRHIPDSWRQVHKGAP